MSNIFKSAFSVYQNESDAFEYTKEVQNIARCMDRCPNKEFMERKDNTARKPNQDGLCIFEQYNPHLIDPLTQKPYKPRELVVSRLHRSEASYQPKPEEIRIPPILEDCMLHLLYVVADADTNEMFPVNDSALFVQQIYEYLWDRTRQIRSEFSMMKMLSNFPTSFAIRTYEYIVRFHLLFNCYTYNDEFEYKYLLDTLIASLNDLKEMYNQARQRGYESLLVNQVEFLSYYAICLFLDVVRNRKRSVCIPTIIIHF
ncbi:hypothetical protein WA158_000825 [Blastocystis sp. Blastoise]